MNHGQHLPSTSATGVILWLLLSAALIVAYVWSTPRPSKDEDGAA